MPTLILSGEGQGPSDVSSLNGLTGAITLAAGTGVTLTPAGNTITIAATGGGSIGGSIASTQVAFGSGTNTITGSANFTYASGTLTLISPADASSALIVSAHSATQSVPIADFASYGDTATSDALVRIHGVGIANPLIFGKTNLVCLETANDATVDWHLSMINRAAPAGTATAWRVDDSGRAYYFSLLGGANGVSLITHSDEFDAVVPGNICLFPSLSGRVVLSTSVQVSTTGGTASFYGTAPVVKQTVTGDRAGNAALASLLTGLAITGLVLDSTSSSGVPSASSLTLSPITALTGGTDAINPHTAATYVVTTAGVDAMTIVAPTTGTDDGKVITITNGSSASHTLTFTGGTLRPGTAATSIATFSAGPGSTLSIMAWHAAWYVIAVNSIASFA